MRVLYTYDNKIHVSEVIDSYCTDYLSIKGYKDVELESFKCNMIMLFLQNGNTLMMLLRSENYINKEAVMIELNNEGSFDFNINGMVYTAFLNPSAEDLVEISRAVKLLTK